MPIPANGLHDRSRRQTIPGNPPTEGIYKDQPAWPIHVSNCIYETYDLGGSLHPLNLERSQPDGCRISSLRFTMCCCPTREALILGGGFRTVAGPLLLQRTHNGFQDRCISWVP